MAEPSKLVAARLPVALVTEAERYAILARTTVSHLLRQGLELRLHAHRWPVPMEGPPPPGTLPPHVAQLLTDLSAHLNQVRQELATCAPPPVLPAPTEPTPTAPLDVDTTRYLLGKLCPRGHAYGATEHSLLPAQQSQVSRVPSRASPRPACGAASRRCRPRHPARAPGT